MVEDAPVCFVSKDLRPPVLWLLCLYTTTERQRDLVTPRHLLRGPNPVLTSDRRCLSPVRPPPNKSRPAVKVSPAACPRSRLSLRYQDDGCGVIRSAASEATNDGSPNRGSAVVFPIAVTPVTFIGRFFPEDVPPGGWGGGGWGLWSGQSGQRCSDAGL